MTAHGGRLGDRHDFGRLDEVDPEFLEHARRENLDQPELPWDA